MRISYREESAVGFRVNLIRVWERGEIPAPIMSASSGPKDYVRNQVWSIFDRYPNVARVLMVRGEFVRSAPFLLFANAAGNVWDMAGKGVVIEP